MINEILLLQSLLLVVYTTFANLKDFFLIKFFYKIIFTITVEFKM